MERDDLCNCCHQQLVIRRNSKGSRYVCCVNPTCKRCKSNAAPAPTPKGPDGPPERNSHILGFAFGGSR
jgi:ssDNA-binding Zn-finger/Zn-ribbon topoisomerase 1